MTLEQTGMLIIVTSLLLAFLLAWRGTQKKMTLINTEKNLGKVIGQAADEGRGETDCEEPCEAAGAIELVTRS